MSHTSLTARVHDPRLADVIGLTTRGARGSRDRRPRTRVSALTDWFSGRRRG